MLLKRSVQKDGWTSLEVVNRYPTIKPLGFSTQELCELLEENDIVEVKLGQSRAAKIRVRV